MHTVRKRELWLEMKPFKHKSKAENALGFKI